MGAARTIGVFGLWVLTGTACAYDPRSEDLGGTDGLSGAGSSSDSSGVEDPSEDVGTTTGDGSDEDGGIKLDLSVPDAGPIDGGGPGCAAVDFLFVVDSSGSMFVHQESLVANFATFVDGIREAADTVDSVHVGVVTSDAYEFNAEQCSDIGQLVTQTRLPDGTTPVCGPWEGRNYLTDADDLESGFACAARVGIHGDQCERPMEGLLRAVDGTHAGAGDCNAGFLREDSLLVIVLLTDEWDGPSDPELPYCDPSPGTPDDWYETVVEARGGIESNVVVLSLLNYETAPGAGPCPPCGSIGCVDEFDTRHVQSFTERFAYGFLGGVCERDYGPYFAAATDVVASACDGYTPVG